MDFHSVMETFAEAWVAANTQTPLTEAAEAQSILVNHGPVGMGMSPGLSTLHDLSNDKRESDSLTDDSCRLVDRQSPNGSHNSPMLMDLRTPPKVTNTSAGKSLPVHCIVEQVPGPNSSGQAIESDSYAIIPTSTPFGDLVRASLIKLGYTAVQTVGAKGAIHIRNWKPLSFEQITDSPEATVGDILGDMTSIATLHIRLYSVPEDPQEWTNTAVRNAVLELLREMSQSKLAKLCPLSQPMLSNIINNKYMGKIGKEKCLEFGLWYLGYRRQNSDTPAVTTKDKPQDGRLTFHPTKELPFLREWFQACRSPSSRLLQMYMDMLNQGTVRQQERPKITLATLKNWWKNERQRVRKSEKSGEGGVEEKKRKRRNTQAQRKENQMVDRIENGLQDDHRIIDMEESDLSDGGEIVNVDI